MCRADHKSSLTLSPQLHGSHHWVKTNIPESHGRPTSEDLETCAGAKTFPKNLADAELAIHSSLVTLILTSWFPAIGTKTSSTLSLLMPFSSTILLGCLCGQVRSDYQQGVTNDGSTATRIPLQEQKWRSWRLFLARHAVRMELYMLVRSLTSSISSTTAPTSTYGEANSCPWSYRVGLVEVKTEGELTRWREIEGRLEVNSTKKRYLLYVSRCTEVYSSWKSKDGVILLVW